MKRKLRVGLIVNPIAGVGGSAGMKGSDGEEVQQRARSRGGQQRASARAARALARVKGLAGSIELLTWAGPMGGQAAADSGLPYQVCGEPAQSPSTAADTRKAATTLCAQGVDLLLFAGGDGTARDLCATIDRPVPVLGIPAGVKMHSGVFAVSPEAAGDIVRRLVTGQLVGVAEGEVRDIDETAFRAGRLRARHFGDLPVPAAARYLQHVKQGGRESEELVADDIAAELLENFDATCLYILGPGSTLATIKRAFGFEGTLLGVDMCLDGVCLVRDVSEGEILAALREHLGPARIVVTAIGGQGHVFGRGNQQISAAVIRAVGVDNITIVASKSKLAGLEGRPLLVDTNDPGLDRELHRLVRVVTGYRDAVLYPLGYDE